MDLRSEREEKAIPCQYAGHAEAHGHLEILGLGTCTLGGSLVQNRSREAPGDHLLLLTQDLSQIS